MAAFGITLTGSSISTLPLRHVATHSSSADKKVLPQCVTLSAGSGFSLGSVREDLSAAISFRYDFLRQAANSRADCDCKKTMQLTLTPIEARVLGALIEKEITTPEYYPLSLNALTNACNQKSNRDPVSHVEESAIRKALNHLEYQSLVRSVSSTDSRVTKFEHRLQDAFNF